jgi:putative oxidoreductase
MSVPAQPLSFASFRNQIKTTQNSKRWARWSPIPLRLVVGLGFIEHGVLKLQRGPEVFAAVLQALGTPFPHFAAWATIATELLGGVAIVAGAYVAFASVPLAAVMLTAIVTVHWQFGFSSVKLLAVTAAGPQFGKPGYEVALLYLACLAALVFGGPGPWAVDNILKSRARK